MSSTRSAQGLRLERMQASPQFSGGRFVNTYPSTAPRPARESSILATLAELAFGGGGRRPAQALPALDPRAAWDTRADTGLRVTWLGHSTMVLEIEPTATVLFLNSRSGSSASSL